MRAQLIAAGAAGGMMLASPLHGHALFPARPVVETMGPHAWVTLKAINGRDDVSQFAVELFEPDGWTTSRHAVAMADRITVPGARDGQPPAVRTIRILVKLAGEAQRQVLVCTKSLPQQDDPAHLTVNTRVCSRVTVKTWS